MIARITSSPEPSNHSTVFALPSNIQLKFHKAPNKSGVSLIIELNSKKISWENNPITAGNYDQSDL